MKVSEKSLTDLKDSHEKSTNKRTESSREADDTSVLPHDVPEDNTDD